MPLIFQFGSLGTFWQTDWVRSHRIKHAWPTWLMQSCPDGEGLALIKLNKPLVGVCQPGIWILLPPFWCLSQTEVSLTVLENQHLQDKTYKHHPCFWCQLACLLLQYCLYNSSPSEILFCISIIFRSLGWHDKKKYCEILYESGPQHIKISFFKPPLSLQLRLLQLKKAPDLSWCLYLIQWPRYCAGALNREENML